MRVKMSKKNEVFAVFLLLISLITSINLRANPSTEECIYDDNLYVNVIKRNEGAYKELESRATEQKDPYAQGLLSLLLSHDNTEEGNTAWKCPFQPDRARQLASECLTWHLANQGRPDVSTTLASFYLDGIGVEQNIDKGFTLLSSTDLRGYPRGITRLALAYTVIKRGDADKEEALRLLNTVKDYPPAVNALGFVHERNRNYEQALEYYTQAIALGIMWSSPRLEELKQTVQRASTPAPATPTAPLLPSSTQKSFYERWCKTQ